MLDKARATCKIQPNEDTSTGSTAGLQTAAEAELHGLMAG